MAAAAKKAAAAADLLPKIHLGRPSTNVTIGIVGLPNVGKSSFFNLLCDMSIPAENFPFCTIDPNKSRVAVPDERFDWLCETYKPASRQPAYLQVMDIAGLVRGASEGAGLGNAFLSHIKSIDAIYHMVRVFDDAEVIHVDDSVDPVRDLQTISDELRLKDIEWVEARFNDKAFRTDKTKKKEFEFVGRVLELLKAGKDVRNCDWKQEEVEWLNEMLLLTAKPVIYLLNMTEQDFLRKKNKWLPKIHQWVQEHGGDPMIPISVSMEARTDRQTHTHTQLHGLSAEERAAFEEANKVGRTMDKVIKLGFSALHLIYFFTAGSDEVKAWTLREGSKAPQAAGRIHTDFERGFIMAETMKYVDLHELGSEAACKAGGKYAMNGKNYTVGDGDIIFFKFNVTAAPAAKKK